MSRIVQLSDLHLREPGKLLYRRIDTAGAARRAIDRINTLSPRPDLVVLSGDLVNTGGPAEYEHLRVLLQAVQLPCALLPGNHDDRSELRSAFPGQPWAHSTLAVQVREVEAGRLLLLDTVVPGEESGEMAPAHLAWLEAASAGVTNSLLFMHHPPVWTGIAGMDALGLRNRELLEEWLARHTEVRGVFCGHVHRSVFTTFAGRPLAIAPAPAHQIALDLSGDRAALAWTMEPGGMLVIDWAPGSVPVVHVLPVESAPVHRYVG